MRGTGALFDQNGEPRGEAASEELRRDFAYSLAEAGYALRSEVRFHVLPEGDLPKRLALYAGGVCFVDGAALVEGKPRPEFLKSPLPRALIEQPALTKENGAPDFSDGAAMAMMALSLRRLALRDALSTCPSATRFLQFLGMPPDEWGGWVLGTPTEETLERIADYWLTSLPPDIIWARIPAEREALLQEAARQVERARERIRSRDPHLPAYAVTPDLLTRFGIPETAVEWVAHAYGWVRQGDEWRGGFLPAQVLAISDGLCDPRRLLDCSGVVMAATTAGKSLIVELRALARHFRRDGKPRRTVWLVPTREIGAERVEWLRGAYSGKGKGSLIVRYSDGEHRLEDAHILAGRFDIAVLVNEKFAYFLQNHRFSAKVGEVALDELSTLAEPDRGLFLKVAMTGSLWRDRMHVVGLTQPSDIGQVVDAMRKAKGQAFHLAVEQRPVPMRHGLWCRQTGIAYFRDGATGKTLRERLDLGYPDLSATFRGLVLHYLKRTPEEAAAGECNNLVIATPTKPLAIHYASMIADLCESDPEIAAAVAENSHTKLVVDRLAGMEPTSRKQTLARLLALGIGFHNADLTLEERKLVGAAFRNREIAILVCTATLAHGVNMPVQTLAFVGWSRHYQTLLAEYWSWCGRAGRYGVRLARPPTALYLSQGGPDSEEYDAIRRVIAAPLAALPVSPPLTPRALESALLFAVTMLRGALAEDPTPEQLVEFFQGLPGGSDPVLPEVVRGLLDELSEGDWEAAIRVGEEDGKRRVALTDLGRIACAHGVTRETCVTLLRWLRETAAAHSDAPWDLLDLLALVAQTPDYWRGGSLRIHPVMWERVREEFADVVGRRRAALGEEWYARSPLRAVNGNDAGLAATLLALSDFAHSEPLWEEGEHPGGIEARYGIVAGSVSARARDVARLLRVLLAVAELVPPETFPAARPLGMPGPSAGVVCVPYDMEDVCDSVLFGMPAEAAALAALPVEGFSRAWVLALYRAIQESGLDRDLPIIERARIFCEWDESLLPVLPTHGLRERLRDAIKESGRVGLARSLRLDPQITDRLYQHPFVARMHLLQGEGRFTAMRVRAREVYGVFRRNTAPDQPIQFRLLEDYYHWQQEGAVEFLAEIGKRVSDEEYVVDRFFADIDPQNGYGLEQVKAVTEEVARRFSTHPWVRSVEVHWTGGKGFHVVGSFPDGVWRPVANVKAVLTEMLARLANDVSLFLRPQPTLGDPHAVIDLMPVMQRGLYRNLFSLHCTSGGVCVPVDGSQLADFDPEREASVPFVMEVLDRIERSTPAPVLSVLPWAKMVRLYCHHADALREEPPMGYEHLGDYASPPGEDAFRPASLDGLRVLRDRIRAFLPAREHEDEPEEIRVARATLRAVESAIQYAQQGKVVVYAEEDDRVFLAVS